MEFDTKNSFSTIRTQCQMPLSIMLLEIQKHKTLQEKSSEWVQNLECSYMVNSKLLGRQTINPLIFPEKRNYVAVSYTWDYSLKSNENSDSGGYYVQSRGSKILVPSEVRDVVLDRVNKYKEYCGLKFFWIDQININQYDPEGKEIAMQSMDKVYSLSNFPVGLLSVHIESEEHMDLLVGLLSGKFVKDEEDGPSFELKPWLFVASAWKVLHLLDLLTLDKWWSRAWIFQEDYISSVKMTLLIPHSPALEYHKRDTFEILGTLSGELCINSAHFRKETTRYCLAYKKRYRQQSEICDKILERAGKYTIILRERDRNGEDIVCKSMSPLIFADIGERGITKHSDLLAIAANCCRYSNRLNTTTLNAMKYSLSLSVLTLYLLNGEIIRNDGRNSNDARSDNIFNFLKKQSLDNFDPPVDQKELSFIKSCRFPKVRLSKEGIETTGQLWKLGKIIYTNEFHHNLPWEKFSIDGLDLNERRRLRQLANELLSGRHGASYKYFARCIDDYLNEDVGLEDEGNSNVEDDITGEDDSTDENESNKDGSGEEEDVDTEDERFTDEYKNLMIGAIVQAIEDGKTLRLACPVDITPKGRVQSVSASYCGIFVSESYRNNLDSRQSYVFTAGECSGDVEKHVSLEVHWDDSMYKGLPRLITKRWVNGWCFCDEHPCRDVVFPWPASLAT